MPKLKDLTVGCIFRIHPDYRADRPKLGYKGIYIYVGELYPNRYKNTKDTKEIVAAGLTKDSNRFIYNNNPGTYLCPLNDAELEVLNGTYSETHNFTVSIPELNLLSN